MRTSSTTRKQGSGIVVTWFEACIAIFVLLILLIVLVTGLFQAGLRGRIARSREDLYRLSESISAFAIFNRVYPEDSLARPFEVLYQVTTPVAFLKMKSLPPDHLRAKADPYHGSTYFYAVHGGTYDSLLRGAWRVLSPEEPSNAYLFGVMSYGPDGLFAKGIDAGILYDPTNGTMSRGNLWNIKGVEKEE